MKFNGSVIGKVFLIIICLLLGAVLAFGGLAAGVYFVLTRSTMADIGEKAGGVLPEGVQIEFDEDIGKMTVLEWGKEIISTMGDVGDTTIGRLEGLLGYEFISNAMYEVLGVDTQSIKESKISDLGKTVTNSLTLQNVSEKFDVALPDMPLFKDPAFLATPISDAFADLDQKKLSQFITIDDDTSAVIKAIEDLTISELGGEKFTEAINDLKLSEIIEIDDEKSSSVLVALKDTKVGELGSEETDTIIKSLFLCEIMTIDESSQKLMQKLKFSSIESQTLEIKKTALAEGDGAFRLTEGYAAAQLKEASGYEYVYGADGTAYVYKTDEEGERVTNEADDAYIVYKTKAFGSAEEEKNYPLIGINDKIGEITFGDVTDIDETDPNTTKLMLSLNHVLITKMDDAIDRMLLDEMIKIDEDSAPVLKSIRYSALSDMKTMIKVSEADAVMPTPEDIAKQVDGYVYKYVTHKGTNIPYVCEQDEYGDPIIMPIDGENYYQVYETKEYEGYYRPLVGLNKTLDDLTLRDVFKEETLNSGVLSLLEPDTKINEISSQVSAKIQGSSLAKLAGVGVLDVSGDAYNMEHTPKEQRAFIWNNQLNEMLSNVISFVDTPFTVEEGVPKANYGFISQEVIQIGNEDGTPYQYTSLSDFVTAYEGDYINKANQDYKTLKLRSNVTVTVTSADTEFLSDGKYYIPVFSLDGDYVLNFVDESDTNINNNVVLCVIENGTEISKHQYFYAYDASNGGAGSGLKYYDGENVVGATGVSGYYEYKKVN